MVDYRLTGLSIRADGKVLDRLELRAPGRHLTVRRAAILSCAVVGTAGAALALRRLAGTDGTCFDRWIAAAVSLAVGATALPDARLPRDDRRLRRARSGADFLGIALAVAVWLGYLVRRQVLRWLAGKRPGGGRTDQVATREPTVSVTASSHGRRGRGSSLSGR